MVSVFFLFFLFRGTYFYVAVDRLCAPVPGIRRIEVGVVP